MPLPLNLPELLGFDQYLGKTCLVISNSGQIKVGRFMGLSELETRRLLRFKKPSGTPFDINPSYLETLEVVDEIPDRDITAGEDPGVAHAGAQVNC